MSSHPIDAYDNDGPKSAVTESAKPQTKTRAGKIAQYKKGNIWHPDYLHTDYLEFWLKDFTRNGSTLNVCCGFSEIGDVRVDISSESTRTMEGDLFKLSELFRPNQFDYVYIDPPFEKYVTGPDRFKWQFDAFKIARKALITRRTKVNVNMPSKYHEYIIAEDSRPSITLLRIDYK